MDQVCHQYFSLLSIHLTAQHQCSVYNIQTRRVDDTDMSIQNQMLQKKKAKKSILLPQPAFISSQPKKKVANLLAKEKISSKHIHL